jgi:hypothetical protein
MIAKMKSNKSVGATIGYNLKDESQVIGVRNLEGDHVQDYEHQMRLTQSLFEGRAENLTGHVILSPSIEDGNKQTVQSWNNIADDYLKKAGLEKNEAMIFLHEDKGHKHLHVVFNRIDEQGNIYRNGNELALSQRIGNEIAQERGMLQAKEVQKENQRLREQGIETETAGTFNSIRSDMRQAATMAKGKDEKVDQEKYLNTLEKNFGYEVKRHVNKETGELRGYSVGIEGSYYKASDIGKDYTLKNIGNSLQMEQQKQQQRQLQQQQNFSLEQMRESLRAKERESKKSEELKEMKEQLKQVAEKKYKNEKEYFAAVEKATGGKVKEHINKETGELRGYGIEKNGVTHNASDIGRQFTLRELAKSKVIEPQQQQQQSKGQQQDRTNRNELGL